MAGLVSSVAAFADRLSPGFLKLVNMSLTAGWLVLAVLLLRLLLKKAPKWILCGLWLLVGLRLLLPYSVESIVSLIPSTEVISPDGLYAGQISVHTGSGTADAWINPRLPSLLPPRVSDTVTSMREVTALLTLVWILGMAGMLLYAAISYIRVRRSVREAIPSERGVWVCDRVESPFILGIVRPRIYLPSAISPSDTAYVLAHERAHISRFDHWWKPLGFAFLTVYWFHPLLWCGYIFLCRDIEYACDEKVIRSLGSDGKKPYSEALLNASVSHRRVTACPLAFGETAVSGRIRSVLNYKKPAFWVIFLSLLLCAALTVCFLTDPVSDDALEEDLRLFAEEQVETHYDPIAGSYHADVYATDFTPVGRRKRDGKTTVYGMAVYECYTVGEDSEGRKQLLLLSGESVPVAITAGKAETNDGTLRYVLTEYWMPRDGSLYDEDMKEKFPARLRKKIADGIDTDAGHLACRQKACEKLGIPYAGVIHDGTAYSDTKTMAAFAWSGGYRDDSYYKTAVAYLQSGTPYAEADGAGRAALFVQKYAAQCTVARVSAVRATPYSAWAQDEFPLYENADCFPSASVSSDMPYCSYDAQTGVLCVDLSAFSADDTAFALLIRTSVGSNRRWYYVRVALPDDRGTGTAGEDMLQRLKETHPSFFGLDTSAGLTVWYAQMSPNSFVCALTPTGQDLSEMDFTERCINANEMKTVLSEYDAPDIRFSFRRNWCNYSSFLVPVSEQYDSDCEKKLSLILFG